MVGKIGNILAKNSENVAVGRSKSTQKVPNNFGISGRCYRIINQITMFNFFKRKTITDNAKDFETQYKIAKIIIFEYLDILFKQIFESSDYKKNLW